jgi:flagellar basal-body rod protein FlgC
MNIFQTSLNALLAERFRMNVIGHNLANINTTRDRFGNINPYRRKDVIFQEVVSEGGKLSGVAVAGVVTDMSPYQKVYDPYNVDSDKDGYVLKPNVNPIVELGNYINSARLYQLNLSIIENAKSLYINTLRLLG